MMHEKLSTIDGPHLRINFKVLCLVGLSVLQSCSSFGTLKNREVEHSYHAPHSPRPANVASQNAASAIDAQGNLTSTTKNDEQNPSIDDASKLDQTQKLSDEDLTYTDEDKAQDVVEKLLSDDESPSSPGLESSGDLKFFSPHVEHELVKKWINFFVNKDRERFARFIYNGAKYRTDIEAIMEEEGVPKELFFVGLIESGYFLMARSHASAVGPWQFIRATGKRYGLVISHQIDERRDLYKATRAAARYFKDLYRIFGSWELSLCAYNAGEFGMMRRIKQAKTEDFFSLATNGHLPRETTNYVPKVMAVMYLYDHLSDYGFNVNEAVENPFAQAKTLKLLHAQPLSKMAKLFNTTVSQLKNLNPELKGSVTPFFASRPYLLRVPARSNPKLIAQIEEKKMLFEGPKSTYESSAKKVQDRLTQRQSVEHLITHLAGATNTNKKENKKALVANTKRTIASWSTQQHQQKGTLIKNNLPFIYTVRAGEGLNEIASIFNISANELSQYNQLNSSKLLKGQKIKLPKKSKTYYVVQKGENLMVIAKKLGTNIALLKHLNTNSKDGQVYAGQKLLVLMN